MALIIGEITRTFSSGDKLVCTVTVPIVQDTTDEVVHTIRHSEPYIEGEAAEITVKRFAREVQAKINNWLTERRLGETNVQRDAFIPILKTQLRLEAK